MNTTKEAHTAKWLKGLGETEFLQFAQGRITREPFPLGGYLYTTTTINADADNEQHYSGNSYEAALLAYAEARAND